MLPAGATSERTMEVIKGVEDHFLGPEAGNVDAILTVRGFSFGGQGQNVAFGFVKLKDWALREKPEQKAQASGTGGTDWVRVDRATADGLRQVGSSVGATLFMTLLAAYYVLLHRLSGQSEVVVGLPVRNRSSEALERVMGFFVNVLPLRMKIDPAQPFLALVEQVREAVSAALAVPDVPFEHLVRELGIARDPSRSPLYQALFSFQDVRARRTHWGELEHEHLLLFQ